MKKIKRSILLIIFSSLILGANSYADNNAKRREQILSTINAELKEISRLNKKTKRKRPNLLLRMADLLLEKARHTKEKENYRYLSLSPSERSRVKKSDYFKKSTKYYKQSSRIGNYILKRFKKFEGLGTVYYILAHSAKEFQEEKKAKDYFSKAIRLTKASSAIRTNAKRALGEIYYNDKNYRKAIPLYEDSLKLQKKDPWWTKDSFNLAWSYFRTGKKNKAILKMREVYRLSKNPNYIDKSLEVERDLAYFYAASGRIKEAVSFYRKIGKNIAENLLKVSVYLIEQGKYTSAEKALSAAGNYQRTDSQKVDIHLALLNLYERFGNQEKHLKSSKFLLGFYKKGKLNKESQEILRYHLDKMSSSLQKQVVSKRYRNQKSNRRKKANYAVEYFSLRAEASPEKAQESYFLAGETSFFDGQFNKSLLYYDKSYRFESVGKTKKYQKLANNGMMVALAAKGISKSSLDKYLIPAYENFLKLNPKTKKANTVFQRLFSSYYDKGDIENAKKVFHNFRRDFSKDSKTQEGMLSKIIEFYKKKGDKDSITYWVGRIDAGDFNVSSNYRKEAGKILLKMQFTEVEEAIAKGDKKSALLGYLNIYKGKKTGKESKKFAAYGAAILYYELGRANEMFHWTTQALRLMSDKEIKQYETSFLKIANDFFGRRDFFRAAQIFEKSFLSLCNLKSKNKAVFFKNANIVLLATGEIKKSKKLIEKAPNCGIFQSYINDSRKDYIQALIERKQWRELQREIRILEKDKANWPKLIVLTDHLQNNNFLSQKLASKRILQYYNESYKLGLNIPLESLDIVAKVKLNKLDSLVLNLKRIKLSFPESIYNKSLERKFKLLEEVRGKAFKILELGSGRGITRSYRVLIESYESFALEIENFNPKGKTKSYVQSFKKTMENSYIKPLRSAARKSRLEAIREIKANSILSEDNKWLMTKPGNTIVEYEYRKNGIIMDRGGK